MAEAKRDGNHVTAMLFVGSDGLTYNAEGDKDTGRLYVDIAGGAGTVTSVSVVSANGFAGTVADATTTPAITLSTTITGILQGNGTAISAASTTGSGAVVLATGPTVVSPIITTSPTAAGATWTSLGTVTTIDINGGTIDGTVIGGSSAAAITATTLGVNSSSLQTVTVNGTSIVPSLQIVGASAAGSTMLAIRFGSSTAQPRFVFAKSRSASIGTNTVVQSGDVLGEIVFNGADGTNYVESASVQVAVDGTPGTNDMPGRIVFSTSADGSASPTARLILDSAGILKPNANDGVALGTSVLSYSDLFLAEGGVINWDNGDATLTQTGNVLALAGADLRVATADVGTNADSVATLSSTSTFTNKTLTSPVITTATLSGTQQFAEGASIAYDAASSADGVYNGFVRAGVAGTTLAFGDLVYLASADSRWELADADAATTSDRFLGMCVLAAASDGDPTVILLQGFIRADAAFPALTIGSAAYVGETAGDIQTAIPTGADNVIRRVGYAWTADELYFCPSMDSQITVA